MTERTDGQRSPLWRSLQLLSQEQGVWRPDLLDLLSTDLVILRQAWGIDLNNGLGAARQTIIASLHAHIAQLRPRPDHQPLSREDRDNQYKRGVITSFNIGQRRELQDTTLTERRAWLADDARGVLCLSTRTSQRDLEHAITQIADMLSRDDYQPPAVPDVQSSEPEDSALIGRNAYTAKIVELAAEGKYPVFVYGEPGTGKSILAEIAARELANGKPVVTLHVANQSILSSEIIEALILDGIQPERDEALRLGHFKRQLAGQTALGAVVIDDITEQTAHFITVLVPSHPSVPVLLTSRQRRQGANPQQPNIAYVELGEFTEEEAQSFLKQALPDSREQERRELIAVLGRRPLMLFHATRFLVNVPSVSPSELAYALSDNFSENLSLIEPSLANTPKLVDLYRLMLDKLTAEDAPRDVLNAFMAATGSTALCSPSFLAFAIRAIAPGAAVNLRLHVGLHELQQWGLLRRSDALADGLWSMHSLTWRILGELRGEAQRVASVQFFEAVADNEKTVRDAELLAPKESFARFMYKNLRAATDLLPGWQWLFCMDVSTWVSRRGLRKDDDPTAQTYIRYEILPMGVRRLDYMTGESGWVIAEEAKDLFSLASTYVLLVRVYDDDLMDDPDPLQYGLQRLRAYLETDDVNAMRQVIGISQARPAFFYRNPEGLQQLVGDMLARMQELSRGSFSSD